jgi:hypothetical protein
MNSTFVFLLVVLIVATSFAAPQFEYDNEDQNFENFVIRGNPRASSINYFPGCLRLKMPNPCKGKKRYPGTNVDLLDYDEEDYQQPDATGLNQGDPSFK